MFIHFHYILQFLVIRMNVDICINMNVKEYEKFMEEKLPKLYKAYKFILDKMTNDYMYNENEVKSFLLSGIVPLVNEHLKRSTEKNKEERA